MIRTRVSSFFIQKSFSFSLKLEVADWLDRVATKPQGRFLLPQNLDCRYAHHTRLTYRLWVYKFSFSCCTARAVPAKPCSWSPKTLYNKEQMNIKNPEGDILSNVLREEILKIEKISQITCDKMWEFPQFRSKVIGKVNCIALHLYVSL